MMSNAVSRWEENRLCCFGLASASGSEVEAKAARRASESRNETPRSRATDGSTWPLPVRDEREGSETARTQGAR